MKHLSVLLVNEFYKPKKIIYTILAIRSIANTGIENKMHVVCGVRDQLR